MMSTRQKSTSPSIALPSIQEMFPEYLMQVPPHLRQSRVLAQRNMMAPPHRSSKTNLIGDLNRPRSFSSPSPYSQPPVKSRVPSSPRSHLVHMPHVPRFSSTPASAPFPVARSGDYPSIQDNSYPHPRSKNADPLAPSFDVLRSDPSSSSLQHITSSATFSNRGGASYGHNPQAGVINGSAPVFRVAASPPNAALEGSFNGSRQSRSPVEHFRTADARNTHDTSATSNYPSIISFPVSSSANGPVIARDQSSDDASNISDDGDISGSTSGKKHVCPTCFKRFNRPSSLRIHVNTHTGETPFQCPWPNCGREFNVNSNMRRHYRNHTTPGFSRSQSNDPRRRRRRDPHQPSFAGGNTSPTVRTTAGQQSLITSPPISSLTMSEDSDEDISDAMEGTYAFDEEDELESPSEETTTRYPRAYGSSSGPREVPRRSNYEYAHTQHFSQSHIRSFRGLNHRSASSPSTSPSSSPPPSEPFYNPSAPYVRSLADSRVSTALRPAFGPAPAPRRQPVKEEPTSDIW